ncbi:MAG: pentapeptide repeat-containing protein [Planctomycetes bacterium]|nr:pentapeptide repeat-containing protein [Planctomycetota bacterium]
MFSRDGDETDLLEDVVAELLADRSCRAIAIIGGVGSGKTTALEHLAAVFADEGGVRLVDDPELPEDFSAPNETVIVIADRQEWRLDGQTVLTLAGWSRDECIEYLLAVHRARCASVMARLPVIDAVGRESPTLWRLILDALAADDSLTDATSALCRCIDAAYPEPQVREAVQLLAFAVLTGSEKPEAARLRLADLVSADEGIRLALQLAAQLVLATDHLVRELRLGRVCSVLCEALPVDLIRSCAAAIEADHAVLARLRSVLDASWMKSLVVGNVRLSQSMAASILVATPSGWIPPPDCVPRLFGAHLDGVEWPRAQLTAVDARNADLSRANLFEATLDKADLRGANLTRARLHGASLRNATFADGNLTRADLSFVRAQAASFESACLAGANLEGALLRGATFQCADLRGARLWRSTLEAAKLEGARIDDADFFAAHLEAARLLGQDLRCASFRGAVMIGADLTGCRLDAMILLGSSLSHANLTLATLTSTNLTHADLHNATLLEAKMADVNLERANLRGADLRNVTFHMGSSRSGLVGSPIASEGSRTGFYTDEHEEQHFRAPEDIRKANLRGADLTGAKIDGTDFYLVDLRDAIYEPWQEEIFRLSGAILGSRV